MAISLGTRLALLISMTLSILVISAGIWVDRQLTRAIYDEEERQVDVHAQTMMATLKTLMLSGQATQARDWLKRMEQKQDVIDIKILRINGEEAFTDTSTIESVNAYLGEQRFFRDPAEPLTPVAESDANFLRASKGETVLSRPDDVSLAIYLPIQVEQQCLACHGYEQETLRGIVKVVQSTMPVEHRIQQMRSQLWKIAIFIVLLLGTLLWLVLRFKVLKPVLRLQEAIMKVGQGDRDARLTINRDDELGQAGLVFNRMQEQLQTTEARIRAVRDNVADAIITTNTAGIIESVNPAVTKIFGYQEDELLGSNVNILMPAPHRQQHDRYIAEYLQRGISRLVGYSRELTGRRKDGSEFPMDITLSEMIVGKEHSFIGIIRDVTERHDQFQALQHQALHDALTKLPNRTLLNDRVEQSIRTAKRQGTSLVLLLADLDRFKEVNDTLGHHQGDQVLIQVAEYLSHVVRGSDTVARLGGDEFAVLLPSATLEDAQGVCRKIIASLEKPFVIEGHSFLMGVSIGIAVYPDHGNDVTTLMQRADVAMYAAKRQHSGYKVYEPDQDQHSLETLSLMSDLRVAIESNEQLMLYYQPVIDLTQGRVTGVEALARWQHPQYGLLQPDDFIPLAEQTGLIKPLTTWVLKTAERQSKRWEEQGLELRIAVNLSAHNLHDLNFPEKFLDIIEHDHVSMPRLRLEITETTIMSGATNGLNALNQLSARGVRISIDDFGTGYSSLNYLKRLPVDEIKIDRSFVTHMTIDENDQVIVRSTIDLAHNMGLKVVAEGVEDEATYNLLKRLHCDSIQGFYISVPLPAVELVSWLKQTDKKIGA